ncbi:MAG: EamA family transporter, partial [Actinomycetota bacterium]
MTNLDERRGVLVGTGAYLLWGFLTVYWKQLAAFDAVELVGWRMTTASVVMVVIILLRGHGALLRRAVSSPAVAVNLVVAALLLATNWGSYVWAVVNDRVIETALGYFIAPLATVAIGVLVLGETPTRSQRVAFALAFVAVVILTVSYGRPPWIALVLAGTWSCYGLAKRRVALDPVDSLAGETFVLAAPAVALLLVIGGGD